MKLPVIHEIQAESYSKERKTEICSSSKPITFLYGLGSVSGTLIAFVLKLLSN